MPVMKPTPPQMGQDASYASPGECAALLCKCRPGGTPSSGHSLACDGLQAHRSRLRPSRCSHGSHFQSRVFLFLRRPSLKMSSVEMMCSQAFSAAAAVHAQKQIEASVCSSDSRLSLAFGFRFEAGLAVRRLSLPRAVPGLSSGCQTAGIHRPSVLSQVRARHGPLVSEAEHRLRFCTRSLLGP